jgi:hypothetical protein
MDKGNIIFIALVIGGYVVRFLMKKSKNTGEKKQGETVEKNSLPTEKSSNFDLALQQFSTRIAQELKNKPFQVKKVSTLPVQQTMSSLSTESSIEHTTNRSENYRIVKRRKHRVIQKIKKQKNLKDFFVASEVLKTKF